MRKTIVASLASLVLATSVLACKGPPQIIAMPAPSEVGKPGQMTVTGIATLEVSPDCADLIMTISADGLRPGLATAAVQAKQHQLLAALATLGIEGSDLKLSTLTLSPIYANTPAGWSQLKVATYRAEIIVTATTHRFDLLASMMDAGASAGVGAMASQFRRSDLPALKKQVREMALLAAKDKANQTAKTLGIEVGRVVSVSEASAGSMWSSAYFPQATANEVETRGAAGQRSIGGALQPLTLEITIGYELSNPA